VSDVADGLLGVEVDVVVAFEETGALGAVVDKAVVAEPGRLVVVVALEDL
jgi:hypothetical protein